MTDFNVQLLKHEEKFKELKEKENSLAMEMQTHNSIFQAFLKENGLSDQFTLAEAMTLAVRKSRD